MADANTLELSGLAALGTLESVCAVLLRSKANALPPRSQRNLDSLQQMRDQADAVIDKLRAELRDNDDLGPA